MSHHPGISTPFDTLDNFEPNILNIIDEYQGHELYDSYNHWFYAWGLSFDVHRAFLEVCFLGELDNVKYLMTQGINPWDDYQAFSMAALSGQLEVMKYLVSVDKKFTADKYEAIHRASSNGHLDVVKYLISLCDDNNEKRFLLTAEFDLAIRSAYRYRHVKTLDYLKTLYDDLGLWTPDAIPF